MDLNNLLRMILGSEGVTPPVLARYRTVLLAESQ